MGCKSILTLLLAAGIWHASPALARDVDKHLPIADVLNDPDFKEKLGNDVSYHFGSDHGPAGNTLGTFTSNRKTNGFGKSDETACKWAMLSALVELRDRAQKLGGNAVVGIVSYYKKDTFASDTEYDCHAGSFVTGVALRGTIVKTGH